MPDFSSLIIESLDYKISQNHGQKRLERVGTEARELQPKEGGQHRHHQQQPL